MAASEQGHLDQPAYLAFLRSKLRFGQDTGVAIEPALVNAMCKPHQRDLIVWAARKGRGALFAAFGLGKSFMQLELCRLLLPHAEPDGRALIVLPLGVRPEFMADAGKLGISVRFVRRSEDLDGPGIYLTNYESVRDGRLDPALFGIACLDEASVLRSFGSKTYQEFLRLFAPVRWRFVATATPSPNNYKELIHYAGFLGVMDTGQALTRFFQRDSTSAGNLTLYPHMVRQFHLWLHSWAAFVQKPSDLGYDDAGYDLPPLLLRVHEVDAGAGDVGADRDGQERMFRDAALGLKEAAAEKRASLPARVAKMMDIVRGFIGSEEGVSQSLLSGEPGTVAGETERAWQEELRGQPSGLPETLDGLAPEKPRANDGARSRLSGTQQGKIKRAKSNTLPIEQTGILAAEPKGQVGSLGADGSRVWSDVAETDEQLCNLQSDCGELASSEALRGPLPQDRDGARTSMPRLQRRHRASERRSQPTIGCHRLSQQLIIWCDLNDEQQAVEDALSIAGISFSSIHGSLLPDEGERRLIEWRSRETDVLIGKPVMLGSGVNLQQCCKEIFLGITYKFNDVIQAVHRVFRFLQMRPVEVHFIISQAEREVWRTIERKWSEHEDLTARMSDLIREHGLSTLTLEAELARTIGVARVEERGTGFHVAHNDCVLEVAVMADNSTDMILTSIPFGNHYEYSTCLEDFGHNDNNARFFDQLDHLTPGLLRVLRPGRIAAIHVKDRVLFKDVTGNGSSSIDPFHADCIAHYRAHGFIYCGMITVVTDVVRENAGTYRLGWTEQCKDGTTKGVGSPEYVLLFRKAQSDLATAYADVPVVKDKTRYTRARWQVDAHAFWRSSGDRFLTAEEFAGMGPDVLASAFPAVTAQRVYDHETHVAVAEALERAGRLPTGFGCVLPGSHHADVWDDVVRMHTLNSAQAQRNLVQHICPLQLDLVERLIRRYTNAGEEVFDPFGGLFTVPYCAMKLGRRGRAVELNGDYYRDGVGHLRRKEAEVTAPSLFDLLATEAAE